MATPVASFTFTPGYGRGPLTVQCLDTSSGSPTNWLWQFDDGNGNVVSSTEQHPAHVFTSPPYYWRFIRLTVANADGVSTYQAGPYPGGVYLQLNTPVA